MTTGPVVGAGAEVGGIGVAGTLVGAGVSVGSIGMSVGRTGMSVGTGVLLGTGLGAVMVKVAPFNTP